MSGNPELSKAEKTRQTRVHNLAKQKEDNEALIAETEAQGASHNLAPYTDTDNLELTRYTKEEEGCAGDETVEA